MPGRGWVGQTKRMGKQFMAAGGVSSRKASRCRSWPCKAESLCHRCMCSCVGCVEEECWLCGGVYVQLCWLCGGGVCCRGHQQAHARACT